MRVHFIAIGGSAMHNLAIALHKKGFTVSGSDDEIVEPSKSRLNQHGLLPATEGWHPEKLTTDIDAVILGMHARIDNPELLKAQELGIKVYSYPEYIYEQSKDKKRVVIGGSHGKTTITAMILHALNYNKVDADYLVGAQLKGFDTMVKITNEAPIIILEGDEYLASPIDRRPKFHLYKANIALLSGIAWDHINVFPTFDLYLKQFDIFIDTIEAGGTLVYAQDDQELTALVKNNRNTQCTKTGYGVPPAVIENGITSLVVADGSKVPLKVFGNHNLTNLTGARLVCNQLGLSDAQFHEAIQSFTGAARRLELIANTENVAVYKDFAHSPSKLKATTSAVKQQFGVRPLVACMELHTFSSLNKDFLQEYHGAMDLADEAIVYFNPHTIAHKKLAAISVAEVKAAFGRADIQVYTEAKEMAAYLQQLDWKNRNLLLMSSGNFDGMDLDSFGRSLAGV